MSSRWRAGSRFNAPTCRRNRSCSHRWMRYPNPGMPTLAGAVATATRSWKSAHWSSKMTRNVVFQATAPERPVLALSVAWIDGGDDNVSFTLTAGAGVGSPLMTLVVKAGGKSRTEVIDIRDGLQSWVNRVV